MPNVKQMIESVVAGADPHRVMGTEGTDQGPSDMDRMGEDLGAVMYPLIGERTLWYLVYVARHGLLNVDYQYEVPHISKSNNIKARQMAKAIVLGAEELIAATKKFIQESGIELDMDFSLGPKEPKWLSDDGMVYFISFLTVGLSEIGSEHFTTSIEDFESLAGWDEFHHAMIEWNKAVSPYQHLLEKIYEWGELEDPDFTGDPDDAEN